MTNRPDLETLSNHYLQFSLLCFYIWANSYKPSNLHSLCVSHAFLMYHLYDGRIGSSVPKKYGHREDGIRTFCSHRHSTGRLLKICLFSIEMSHNCPRNKSLIFLLITCSSFFPPLFEKSSVTWRCGIGSLIYKNEILFAKFSIVIVNLQGVFLQIVLVL
jgi:hypothetical protein